MQLAIAAAFAIAATLTIATAVVPSPMQYGQKPPAARTNRSPVGLPVFSSDGKQIGKVVAAGIGADGEPLLVAEIQRPG
jgi:hypothetical protein